MLRLGLRSMVGSRPPTVKPPVPTLGTPIVISDTQINIPVTSSYHYEMWYSTDNVTYTKHGDSSSSPYAMTGLTTFQLYYFKARSINGSKFSAFSNIVSETCLAPPSNVLLTYIEGGVRITWIDVPNNIGDVLIYSSKDGGEYSLLATVLVGVQTYDHLIEDDGTYQYILRAEIEPWVYSSQYQAIYDTYTTKPSTLVAYNQDVMVRKMVTDETWETIAAGWIFAGHINSASESLINIKNPSGDKAVLVDGGSGVPAFTPYEGFTGNGTNNYINLKWNPTDDGSTIYSLNAASVLIATKNNKTKGRLYGRAYFANCYTLMVFGGSGCTNSAYANTGTSAGNNVARYLSIIRSASDLVSQYINKGTAVTATTVSTNLPNRDLFALANNTGAATDAAGDFADSQISAIILGNFNETQKNLIIDAIEAYMVSNGKGIL